MLLFLVPAGVCATDGAEKGGASAASRLELLAGERHDYDISFLWFGGLARGRLLLEELEGEGTYRASLEAETRGIASWLSGHQVRRFVTLMEFGKDGRLLPLLHEVHVVKGRGDGRRDHTTRYLFDYRRGEVRCQRSRDGVAYRDVLLKVSPEAFPSDILTAFYNFRIGAFGPVLPASRHVVPVCAGEEVSPLALEVLPVGDGEYRDFFPPEGLLCRVALASEIFRNDGGSVYVWFDHRGRPARGLIENVIGLGDVRGRIDP